MHSKICSERPDTSVLSKALGFTLQARYEHGHRGCLGSDGYYADQSIFTATVLEELGGSETSDSHCRPGALPCPGRGADHLNALVVMRFQIYGFGAE